MTNLRVTFIVLSIIIVGLNASVNYFDPFQGGLGKYSTSVGSSTTVLWAYTLVFIDVIYVVLAFRLFRRIEK